MATLNEGLGFGELGGIGTDTGSKLANSWITGSYTDGYGRLRSVEIENAAPVYGYKVKAGSLIMSTAGYSGLVHFKESFADTNYFIVASAQNWTLPQANTAGSLTSFGVSGIRRASGCWLYGPSGTTADWIAVGI